MFNKYLKVLVILTLTSFVLISCSSQSQDDITELKKELSELTSAHNALVGSQKSLAEEHADLKAEVACLDLRDASKGEYYNWNPGSVQFPCSWWYLYTHPELKNDKTTPIGTLLNSVPLVRQREHFKFLCEQRVKPALPKEFSEIYIGCQ